MCDHCFTNPIHHFKSPKELAVLQAIIEDKVKTDSLSPVQKEPEAFFEPFVPYRFYKCGNCSDVWMLSLPESPKGGFFLTRQAAVKYKKELSERKGVEGALWVIAAIVLTLIALIMILS